MRVIYQNTERLKNKRISTDEKKLLLTQNEQLTQLTKKLNDNKNFMEVLSEFLRSKRKDQANFQILQKELEAFASNKLFDKAAKLQTL